MTLQELAREACDAFETAERPGRGLIPSEGQAISDMLELLAGIDEGENTDPALLARLASAARDAGSEHETTRYVRLREEYRDGWVKDLVYEAHGHGEMLPDDWRYACMRSALQTIADMDEDDDPDEARSDFADSEVDTYTNARFEWLSSDLSRMSYVDEAVEEYGVASGELPAGVASVAEMIALGQYREAEEVFGLVLDSLRARLDEIESGEEDS